MKHYMKKNVEIPNKENEIIKGKKNIKNICITSRSFFLIPTDVRLMQEASDLRSPPRSHQTN